LDRARADFDRDLLRRYHENGDVAAREQLVQRHLPLVRSLARRFAGRGESLEDLEQVGAIGLIKAIDRFEMSREVALTSYATPNVVGEIKRHFRDRGSAIRIPRNLKELSAKLGKAMERLTAVHGRSPTIAELATELDTTPEQVLEALEAGSARSTVSLSSGPDADDLDPMEIVGEEDEGYDRVEDRASLEPAIGTLPQRERDILKMRFEDGMTQSQIAERVGVSQMHVSRLIRKSIDQLRDELL
jgi:RNA polymerase sigma-B factor